MKITITLTRAEEKAVQELADGARVSREEALHRLLRAGSELHRAINEGVAALISSRENPGRPKTEIEP